jgi:hypothetical protein
VAFIRLNRLGRPTRLTRETLAGTVRTVRTTRSGWQWHNWIARCGRWPDTRRCLRKFIVDTSTFINTIVRINRLFDAVVRIDRTATMATALDNA